MTNKNKIKPITIEDFVKETNPNGPIVVWMESNISGCTNEDITNQTIKIIYELQRLGKTGIPINGEVIRAQYSENGSISKMQFAIGKEFVKFGAALYVAGCFCCAESKNTLWDVIKGYHKKEVGLVLHKEHYSRENSCVDDYLRSNEKTTENYFRDSLRFIGI